MVRVAIPSEGNGGLDGKRAGHFGHFMNGESAYPNLIEIPLFTSSLCVSVHTPDKALTSVVFPWSTWPTMPILTQG